MVTIRADGLVYRAGVCKQFGDIDPTQSIRRNQADAFSDEDMTVRSFRRILPTPTPTPTLKRKFDSLRVTEINLYILFRRLRCEDTDDDADDVNDIDDDDDDDDDDGMPSRNEVNYLINICEENLSES